MSSAPSLLTTREVAELFRVSERTIRAWTSAGTLRAVRIGTRVRYRRRTLEEMLDALETPTEGDTETERDGAGRGGW